MADKVEKPTPKNSQSMKGEKFYKTVSVELKKNWFLLVFFFVEGNLFMKTGDVDRYKRVIEPDNIYHNIRISWNDRGSKAENTAEGRELLQTVWWRVGAVKLPKLKIIIESCFSLVSSTKEKWLFPVPSCSSKVTLSQPRFGADPNYTETKGTSETTVTQRSILMIACEKSNN